MALVLSPRPKKYIAEAKREINASSILSPIGKSNERNFEFFMLFERLDRSKKKYPVSLEWLAKELAIRKDSAKRFLVKNFRLGIDYIEDENLLHIEFH